MVFLANTLILQILSRKNTSNTYPEKNNSNAFPEKIIQIIFQKKMFQILCRKKNKYFCRKNTSNTFPEKSTTGEYLKIRKDFHIFSVMFFFFKKMIINEPSTFPVEPLLEISVQLSMKVVRAQKALKLKNAYRHRSDRYNITSRPICAKAWWRHSTLFCHVSAFVIRVLTKCAIRKRPFCNCLRLDPWFVQTWLLSWLSKMSKQLLGFSKTLLSLKFNTRTLMFPIWDKISKLGFRVPERKTRGFPDFENSAILNDNKLNITLIFLCLVVASNLLYCLKLTRNSTQGDGEMATVQTVNESQLIPIITAYYGC